MKTNKKSEIIAPDTVIRVYEAILSKKYTLGDIQEGDLTSRNLKYWMDSELLLTTRSKEDNKWSRFCFVDYIWLKMLLYMSDMDIGKPGNVKKIKECLELLPPPTVISSLSTEAIKALAKEDDTVNWSMAGLANILADSLIDKTPYYIRLFKGGTCQFIKDQGEIVASTSSGGQEPETYIQIALLDIFTDFVNRMILAGRGKDPMLIGVITNQEGTLLQHIDNRIVTDVMIKFKHSKPIAMSVNAENKSEVADYLSRHMVKGDYSGIEYITVENEVTSFSKRSKAN